MKIMKILRYTKCRLFSLESCHYSVYSRLKLNSLKKYNYHSLQRNLSILSYTLKNVRDNTFEDKENKLHGDSYATFTNQLLSHPGIFHNVLVIQPRDKTKSEKTDEAERKLAEASALINTLRQWKVVEKIVISTSHGASSKYIFGSGNLEKIKHIIQTKINISAIFIGVDIMTALQNTNLEEYFKIPVFDRYQVILQIFQEHAHTKEAKLQLALAEIPYLRVKLSGMFHKKYATNFAGAHHIGGDGETFMDRRRSLLQEREIKIKNALEKVKNQRELLRNTERRKNLPLVAVVGYTNCGKTTLIKALTNDERLMPEDKLFATLDVTLHAGRLPSGQQVLFIDTVGFISNVPTSLIQSFKSTLEEIALADIIIHVRDISHPHAEHQKHTVLKTLQELDLPEKLLNSILEVRNKSDLLESIPTDHDSEDAMYISATEGSGLAELQEHLDVKLVKATDRSVLLIRVPNGREEYRWLMKEGTIRDSIVDTKNENFLIVEVILSKANAAKFKHRFGNMTVSIRDIIQC